MKVVTSVFDLTNSWGVIVKFFFLKIQFFHSTLSPHKSELIIRLYNCPINFKPSASFLQLWLVFYRKWLDEKMAKNYLLTLPQPQLYLKWQIFFFADLKHNDCVWGASLEQILDIFFTSWTWEKSFQIANCKTRYLERILGIRPQNQHPVQT